jgi:hypothetical protein
MQHEGELINERGGWRVWYYLVKSSWNMRFGVGVRGMCNIDVVLIHVEMQRAIWNEWRGAQQDQRH